MTDLGKVESECGAEDESQEGQPANSETDAVRKTEEWPGDEWLPHGFYWSCDDRVGDEAEGDDARQREREKRETSVITRCQIKWARILRQQCGGDVDAAYTPDK